jgi:hypothetical protein
MRLLVFLFLLFTKLCLKGQHVGIGTTSPQASLHVKGQDPNVWFQDIYPFLLHRSTGDTALIVKDNGQVFLSHEVADFASLNIRRNATAAVPHLVLEKETPGVYGTINFTNQNSGTIFWDAVSEASAGNSWMGWYVPGINYLLYANAAGNTGIRTAAPQARLDVNGNVAFAGLLNLGGVTPSPGALITSGGAGGSGFTSADQIYLDQLDTAYNLNGTYLQGSLNDVVISRPLPVLVDTSKVAFSMNMTLEPIHESFYCVICGPTTVRLDVVLRNYTTGVELNRLTRFARLENGEQPLTVVMDGMFYVQHDFNFPATYEMLLKLKVLDGPPVATAPLSDFSQFCPNKLRIRVIPQTN